MAVPVVTVLFGISRFVLKRKVTVWQTFWKGLYYWKLYSVGYWWIGIVSSGAWCLWLSLYMSKLDTILDDCIGLGCLLNSIDMCSWLRLLPAAITTSRWYKMQKVPCLKTLQKQRNPLSPTVFPWKISVNGCQTCIKELYNNSLQQEEQQQEEEVCASWSSSTPFPVTVACTSSK